MENEENQIVSNSDLGENVSNEQERNEAAENRAATARVSRDPDGEYPQQTDDLELLRHSEPSQGTSGEDGSDSLSLTDLDPMNANGATDNEENSDLHRGHSNLVIQDSFSISSQEEEGLQKEDLHEQNNIVDQSILSTDQVNTGRYSSTVGLAQTIPEEESILEESRLEESEEFQREKSQQGEESKLEAPEGFQQDEESQREESQLPESPKQSTSCCERFKNFIFPANSSQRRPLNSFVSVQRMERGAKKTRSSNPGI